MTNFTELPFEISIKPPRYLGLVLQGLHGLAFLACWLNGLPIVYRSLLAMLIIGFCQHTVNRVARASLSYLRYTASQCWYLSCDAQEYFPVSISPNSVIGSELILLRYSVEMADKVKFRTLFIARRSMPGREYRQLLVKLKLSSNNQER